MTHNQVVAEFKNFLENKNDSDFMTKKGELYMEILRNNQEEELDEIEYEFEHIADISGKEGNDSIRSALCSESLVETIIHIWLIRNYPENLTFQSIRVAGNLVIDNPGNRTKFINQPNFWTGAKYMLKNSMNARSTFIALLFNLSNSDVDDKVTALYSKNNMLDELIHIPRPFNEIYPWSDLVLNIFLYEKKIENLTIKNDDLIYIIDECCKIVTNFNLNPIYDPAPIIIAVENRLLLLSEFLDILKSENYSKFMIKTIIKVTKLLQNCAKIKYFYIESKEGNADSFYNMEKLCKSIAVLSSSDEFAEAADLPSNEEKIDEAITMWIAWLNLKSQFYLKYVAGTGCILLGNVAQSDEMANHLVHQDKLHRKVIDYMKQTDNVADLTAGIGLIRNLAIPLENKSTIVASGIFEICEKIYRINFSQLTFTMIITLRFLVKDSYENSCALCRQQFVSDLLDNFDSKQNELPIKYEIGRLIIAIIRSLTKLERDPVLAFALQNVTDFIRPIECLFLQTEYPSLVSEAIMGFALLSTKTSTCHRMRQTLGKPESVKVLLDSKDKDRANSRLIIVNMTKHLKEDEFSPELTQAKEIFLKEVSESKPAKVVSYKSETITGE